MGQLQVHFSAFWNSALNEERIQVRGERFRPPSGGPEIRLSSGDKSSVPLLGVYSANVRSALKYSL